MRRVLMIRYKLNNKSSGDVPPPMYNQFPTFLENPTAMQKKTQRN